MNTQDQSTDILSNAERIIKAIADRDIPSDRYKLKELIELEIKNSGKELTELAQFINETPCKVFDGEYIRTVDNALSIQARQLQAFRERLIKKYYSIIKQK